MKINKVFGPPGSGKTTYLLNVAQSELERGISPAKIGVVRLSIKIERIYFIKIVIVMYMCTTHTFVHST